jgi:hypothetical protein
MLCWRQFQSGKGSHTALPENIFQQCFQQLYIIGRLAEWPMETILREDVDM